MKVKIDDISKTVSNKLGIDKNIIEEVSRSQWNLIKDELQDYSNKTIKIIYLGKFARKKKPPTKAEYEIKRKMLNESNKTVTGNL